MQWYLGTLLLSVVSSLSMPRATPPRMAVQGFFGKLMGAPTFSAASIVDKAPSLERLQQMLREVSTTEECAFRTDIESGRAERASSLATKRLFDGADGDEKRVTLYRDTAAWCPCAFCALSN